MTLKELIHIRNTTVKDFAGAIGVSPRTLEAYTSGQRDLNKASAEMLGKIADGLHISRDDLLREINGASEMANDIKRRDNMQDGYSTDRSFLFGRLMGIHEYTAILAEGDDVRVLRLQSKYTAHPKTTFAKIESEIMPDMYAKLSVEDYDRIMDAKAQIVAVLQDAGYTDDPLDPLYLIGYHISRKLPK